MSAAPVADYLPGRTARPFALWALLRVPLILIVAFVCRDLILALINDPRFITLRAIEVGGTPVARVLLFCVLAVIFAALWYGARQLGESRGYWLAIGLVAAFLFGLFKATGTPLSLAAPVLLVFAANLAPDRVLGGLLSHGRREQWIMSLAAGVAELLLFRRYISWVMRLWTGRRPAPATGWIVALPAILFASALSALLMRSPYLATVEQALRLTNSARVFARGDFNWIELSAGKQYLFAAGHGVPRVLRYDVANLDKAPLASSIDTGSAQDFAYEPVANEIYVYNSDTRDLIVLDADTLGLKRSMPIAGLATGDSWTIVDTVTGTIALASEADLRDGNAFLVIDRATGKVLDRRDFDAGSVLLVPQTSRLYLSFFRRSKRLISFDLKTMSVVAEAQAPQRVDRMAHLERSNEILLVAPTQGQIARFDSETLAAKGAISAIFGVRTLVLDPVRNVLLCGSLVTGEVAVLSLETFQILSRAYLGPWLRTIQVDSARGVAFVSSNGALYEWRYGDLR